MAVYVDLPRYNRHVLLVCHMMADTMGELEAMAGEIGLQPDRRHGDHYDLSASKRRAAIRRGAKGVDSVALVHLRRHNGH